MLVHKWLLIIILGTMVTIDAVPINAGDQTVKPKGEGEKPIIGNQGVMVEEEELESLISLGLEGSSEAALRLYHFYEFGSYDEQASLYWARIAAENGSPVGQYALWQRLRVSQEPHDQKRALFWLRRSAQAGNSRAIDALKAWEEKNK